MNAVIAGAGIQSERLDIQTLEPRERRNSRGARRQGSSAGASRARGNVTKSERLTKGEEGHGSEGKQQICPAQAEGV
jgi:hypothetical protein